MRLKLNTLVNDYADHTERISNRSLDMLINLRQVLTSRLNAHDTRNFSQVVEQSLILGKC